MLYGPGLLHAQELPADIVDRLTAHSDFQDAAFEISEYAEHLMFYLENPLDLNTTALKDFISLGLLSEQQWVAIINHRDIAGAFIAVEELQSIKEITIEDIRLILPFVKINKTVFGNSQFVPQLNHVTHRLYLKQGRSWNSNTDPSQTIDTFVGSSDRLNFKYQGSVYNQFRVGFLCEKDAGEKHLFDYYTYHVSGTDLTPWLLGIILGDYSVSMGQGLIVSSSFGRGKSIFLSQLKQSTTVFRPYTSLNENLFLRGVAVTLGIGNRSRLNVFYSSAKRDGHVLAGDTLFSSGTEEFSSLLLSGYHRNERELAGKNLIRHVSRGLVYEYVAPNYNISLNIYHQRFSASFRKPERIYNIHHFRGNRLLNVSMDYGVRLQNLTLFGEIAISRPGKQAILAGIILSMNNHLHLGILWRKYHLSYHAIHPNAFGEGSTASNERGLYSNIEIQLGQNWIGRAFFDMWEHPWVRFRIPAPSAGHEFAIRIDHIITDRYALYFQVSQAYKRSASETDSHVAQWISKRHIKFRAHGNIPVSGDMTLRCRFELVRSCQPDQYYTGYMTFQDVIFRPLNGPVSISARLALFNTENYESRIYAYENGLLNESSIPAYSGSGHRYYINIRWKPVKALTTEFRWARTSLRATESSTNWRKKNGPGIRSEYRCQVRYVF